MAEEFNLGELRNIYRFEDERIKTFSSWKINFPVDAERLAKAGFYYTGIEDEVICFSCEGHINNWNYGEIVQKKHLTMFPDCDFVNNRSNNVPSKRSNNNNNCKNITKSDSFSRLNKFEKMKSLQERIVSFTSAWPLLDINVENMAKAGFFYLGYEDKVQCPFCRGIISNWEVVDDPIEEHAKHFPCCNYVCDILSNLSLKSQNQEEYSYINNSKYTHPSTKSRLLDKNQEHVNLKKLGVHLHSVPANPQQASINSRLRSFLSWPTTTPVSIEDLAKAGFFYIGIKDHTKCFHCDGGLCNWEIGDDPWVEHAKWFRNCSFLQLNKGLTFIEECTKKTSNNEMKSTFQNPNILMELPMKVDAAMESDIVKKILETNLFPKYLIRATLLHQIKSTGKSFSTVEDLCVAIGSTKNEMEKEKLPLNGYNTSKFETFDMDLRKCAIDSSTENKDMESKAIIESSSGISKQNLKSCDEETKSLKEEYLCIICMEQKVGVVFLPCGHLLACTDCASALKICAMCRKTIEATVRAYLP